MILWSCLQSVARSTVLLDQESVCGNINGTCLLRHRPTANGLFTSSSSLNYYCDESVIAPISLGDHLQLNAVIFIFLNIFLTHTLLN